MKHITDAEIRLFHTHKLASDEEMLLLDHMAKCDFCAGRLFSALPERELLTPPPDLCSNIVEAAKRMPSRKEKQREFYRYSTKVVLAMGLALSLLVFCNFSKDMSRYFPAASSLEQNLSTQENLRDPSASNTVINPEWQDYLESLQKQEKKKKETQEQKEKFLQEKQAQMERWKQREKNSGRISDGLNNFSSGILSYFKMEQKEN